MIESVTYFWGLFESAEGATADEADYRACFEAPDVPAEVSDSFERERIADLEGEFGADGLGSPTEVDHLEYRVGGVTRRVRVLNRGISLFQAETPELLRLHRFFSVLREQGG